MKTEAIGTQELGNKIGFIFLRFPLVNRTHLTCLCSKLTFWYSVCVEWWPWWMNWWCTKSYDWSADVNKMSGSPASISLVRLVGLIEKQDYGKDWVCISCDNMLNGFNLGSVMFSDGVKAINNGFHLVWWLIGQSGFWRGVWCNDHQDSRERLDHHSAQNPNPHASQVLYGANCAMCHQDPGTHPLNLLVPCVQTTGSSDTSLVCLPTPSHIQGKPS